MTVQRDPEGNERKYLHNFADFASSPRRVLEIGCGEGRLTWKYARETSSTIAIDPDVDALRVATLDRPSDLESKVHFSLARSEQLPFSNQTFDMGILAWSF
jgi:ubiquinone/menaquinone biosynthesis C-methylase UbiE